MDDCDDDSFENIETGVSFKDKNVAFICIDGSEHSTRAFNWYAENAYHPGTSIALLHIYVPPDISSTALHGDQFMESYTAIMQASISKSKETAEKYKEACKSKNIPYKSYIRTVQDSIGNTICSTALEYNASLIVIGQRGLGKLRRTIFGSVSDYVLRHSKIAVLIIPPDKR